MYSSPTIIVTKNLVRGFTLATLAISMLVGNTLHKSILACKDSDVYVSASPNTSQIYQTNNTANESRWFGIQLSAQNLGELKTETLTLLLMITGLYSLNRRYRKQPLENALANSGFYTE